MVPLQSDTNQIPQSKKPVRQQSTEEDKNFLGHMDAAFAEMNKDNTRQKTSSFYSKQPGKVNLTKLKKVQMIVSYLERLGDLIKSFRMLNLTQIIQLYLKVEVNFTPAYRKKTQKILRQMFSLEMIRPHEENDLNQSLQNIIQQILTLEESQAQLD